MPTSIYGDQSRVRSSPAQRLNAVELQNLDLVLWRFERLQTCFAARSTAIVLLAELRILEPSIVAHCTGVQQGCEVFCLLIIVRFIDGLCRLGAHLAFCCAWGCSQIQLRGRRTCRGAKWPFGGQSINNGNLGRQISNSCIPLMICAQKHEVQ